MLDAIRNAGPMRRALLAIGGLTFVIGVALLGYGGYGALQGEEERPSAPLVDVGDLRTPTPRPTDAPPTPTEPTPPPAPPLGDSEYTMVIDRIGVNAAVESYGLDANAVPVVPTGPGAGQIVAWYEFSARPGVGSNAVFAGHVTWNGVAVFYNLSTVAAGDEIKLLGHDGTQLVYKVSDVFQVDPADPDSVNVMRPTDSDVITIITCDGTFVDTNDPVFGGDYSNRLVVRAGLDHIETPSAVSVGG